MLIRLTGAVTIEEPGGALRHLSSAQAQVAFARLTLERANGTGRDQLADTLWPEGLPDTWASALRSVVSRVRAFAVSSDTPDVAPVVSQGGRYLLRLPTAATVDLECAEDAVARAGRSLAASEFSDARRLATAALACLRSPFLPDHEGEWVTGIRERLHELLVSGLETASLAAAALGDEGGALRFADEAVRHAPLRESAHRCRMSAHAAAGNRAEALRSYNRLRQVLAEEMGVDPAPETQAAYLDLLGAPVAPLGRTVIGGGPRPAATPPFVGRRAELTLLADAWARAEHGSSRIVLITGEPGIGKTRLVTAAAREVGLAGGIVMYGRCDPGVAVPYQPFVEAIGDFMTATPADAMPELTSATHATLAALVDRSADDNEGTSASKQAELLFALGDLLVRVARDQPVFLVLDGIDTADRDSLVLLRHVLRRRSGMSLLVVATAGTTGQGLDNLMSAVRDVDREAGLDRVELSGLREPELAALVRHVRPPRSGEPPALHRLIEDTAGNPHLVLELLRTDFRTDTVPEQVPSGIHDYATLRLAGLEPGPRMLLRAAAVAGSSFELDVVAEAAELDADKAIDSLDVLIAEGLVTELVTATDGLRQLHEYRFTHDVLRRSIYQRCSEARRRRLHSRLADAIETRHGDDLASFSGALAHHRAAGAPPRGDQRAVRWGWHAADRATRQGAPNEAVRLHRQALDHVPAGDPGLRAEAVANLGLAQFAAGQTECEQTLFDGAVLALHSGRPEVAARAVLGLADAVSTRPRLRGEAVALIDTLVRAADGVAPGQSGGESIDDVTLGRLLARQSRLGSSLSAGPASRAALAALARELNLLEGADHVERRRNLAEEMLDVATAVHDSDARIVAAHHRAMVAETTGDVSDRGVALAELASAVDDGDGDRVLFGDALLVEHAVAVAVTQGRFTDAMAAAGLAAAVPGGSHYGIAPAPGSLAGRQMHVARWLRASSWPTSDGRFAGNPEAIERSMTALVGGDRGRPHLTVRALATGAEPLPPGDEWLHVVGLLALGAVELGDPSTADAVRTLLTPYANLTCGVGYRSFVGPASFHLGRLAVVIGDWSAAERHLTSVLSDLAGRQARPWMAMAQFSLARALDGRGRSADRRWAEALRGEANRTLSSLGLQQRVA